MLRSLLRDRSGASLVEFTVVFPIFMLVAFGTVDVTYMLWEWAQANKAVYRGARLAVVSDPVATGITSLDYDEMVLGAFCFDTDTGTYDASVSCPVVNTVCTPADAEGACSAGQAFDEDAFTPILEAMQVVFPRLDRQNVQIRYVTNALGFMGRPDGLPMNVTVRIRCMTHEFFFIGALMGWVFPDLPDGCPDAPAGPAMPEFATTLPSEAMGAL